MIPEVVTPPASDALTLGVLKALLRIDDDQFDTHLTALLPAAATHLEQAYGCVVLSQTRRAWFNPSVLLSARSIELPLWPVTAVRSITVYDVDDVAAVISSGDYYLDTTSGRSLSRVVWKATAAVCASTLREINAIAVEFVVGSATEASAPSTVILALAQLVGYWLERPEGAEAVEPASVRVLMSSMAPSGTA
jgi:uncharacterized phiE125 gp8 family phage protein